MVTVEMLGDEPAFANTPAAGGRNGRWCKARQGVVRLITPVMARGDHPEADCNEEFQLAPRSSSARKPARLWHEDDAGD